MGVFLRLSSDVGCQAFGAEIGAGGGWARSSLRMRTGPNLAAPRYLAGSSLHYASTILSLSRGQGASVAVFDGGGAGGVLNRALAVDSLWISAW
eukprot:444862-Pleurochrysis_carterae.AAC.1